MEVGLDGKVVVLFVSSSTKMHNGWVRESWDVLWGRHQWASGSRRPCRP